MQTIFGEIHRNPNARAKNYEIEWVVYKLMPFGKKGEESVLARGCGGNYAKECAAMAEALEQAERDLKGGK